MNFPASQSQPLLSDGLAAASRSFEEANAAVHAPYDTPEEARGRTFMFRVEFIADLHVLRAMLEWALERWWSTPESSFGEATVKMTLAEQTLTLDEVRWLFAQGPDCHVAVETLALSSTYTGERSFLNEVELGARCPALEHLRQSLRGSWAYRTRCEAAARSAQGAFDGIEQALRDARTPHRRRKAA